MTVLDCLHEPLNGERSRVIRRIWSKRIIPLPNSSEERDPLRRMNDSHKFGMWLHDLIRMCDFGWDESEIACRKYTPRGAGPDFDGAC